MKCLALWLLAVTLALPAFGDKVQNDYDHGVNFEQFHTYCWGHIKTSNPFYVSRIRDAVDRNLQTKGWQLVTSNCDATVFATSEVRDEKQVETYYNGYGGGWGGGWDGDVGEGVALVLEQRRRPRSINKSASWSSTSSPAATSSCCGAA
jgi:hypothetical protein